MKRFFRCILEKVKAPEMSIFLLVVIVGTPLMWSDRVAYITYCNTYNYEAVLIKAYDKENQNLNSTLFEEIKLEIEKNSIESELQLDSASNAVIIYKKNLDFVWFIEWCMYIFNQAISNINNKQASTGCIYCQFYAY
jgi:hypothetical protein